MIKNFIFLGFNLDFCICRKGDDYYFVVLFFEWFLGIFVYYFKDLKNWELYIYILIDEIKIDLKKFFLFKGIWVFCLIYCEEEDLFYIVYGIMNFMNVRYFDVDNYLIILKDIKGEWSELVYLYLLGFDVFIFYDDDGKKWIVLLDWEIREGYEKFGVICLVEYCIKKKEIVGYLKRIWLGGIDRGCIEVLYIIKCGDYYYIMCVEGGIGYGYSVIMGRVKNIWGFYEKDLMNLIVILILGDFYERYDFDYLKFKYYNLELKF